jgi:hypothetical protein
MDEEFETAKDSMDHIYVLQKQDKMSEY